MEFTSLFNILKNKFNLEASQTDIPSLEVSICNYDFHSNNYVSLSNDTCSSENLDKNIVENNNFTYPVFVPDTNKKYDRAIILLHGLNERSWNKYLVWAYYLSKNTGRPVFLFPISFHMNRSPESWSNPRAMLNVMDMRKNLLQSPSMLSFANIALSKRLSEHPLRFLSSGYQSINDISQLVTDINQGKHPLLNEGSKVDFFAYSIGAFMSQVMMIANPNQLFNDSKLFIFCGGSMFSEMNGTSKLIMDSQAFSSLREYYINGIEQEIKGKNQLSEFLTLNQLGHAFRTMLRIDNLKSYRENAFHQLKDRMSIVALKNDLVIPAKGIIEAFKTKNNNNPENVTVLDFPYEYTHESPFPVANKLINKLVDSSFELVFNRAVAFLR